MCHKFALSRRDANSRFVTTSAMQPGGSPLASRRPPPPPQPCSNRERGAQPFPKVLQWAPDSSRHVGRVGVPALFSAQPFPKVLPWVPDSSRCVGRVGVPAIRSASSVDFSFRPRVLRPPFSHRIYPNQPIVPPFVPRIRTPYPIPRRRDQTALHRIHVHVFQLLHLLFVTPYIEIVKPLLPKLRQRILRRELKCELPHNALPPPRAHLPRHPLLQNLQHGRRRPFHRLADQQMNVFRHHHESHQRKSINIANLAQRLHEQIARSFSSQQRQ